MDWNSFYNLKFNEVYFIYNLCIREVHQSFHINIRKRFLQRNIGTPLDIYVRRPAIQRGNAAALMDTMPCCDTLEGDFVS